MRIGICDDDATELDKIASMVDQYKTDNSDKCNISYVKFQNPDHLIVSLEQGLKYDVILLDVIMPGITGIDVAQEIRNLDTTVKIIFLTSSPEFAVDSYSVWAYFYMLKPVLKSRLFELFDKIVNEIQNLEYITVKCSKIIHRILLFDIEFIEVIGRKLFYHIIDGRVLETIDKFSEVEKYILLYKYFVKPHRSYIVNIEHIAIFGKKELEMKCGVKLPIAKGSYNDFMEEYISYCLDKNEVLRL